MFAEIIEYENALDKIKEIDLSESQIKSLFHIIEENPTISAPKLIEITNALSHNDVVILDSGTYSVDPILNESETVNLLEIAIPAITKHIPTEILCYLTETHARVIIDKILDVEFDEYTSREELEHRIDELFSAGDISIPVQGLRRTPATLGVVMNGVFTHKLHKGIQFSKEQYQKPVRSQCMNKNTLRNALNDYKMVDTDTPLSKVLPKFVMILNNLIGDKK